MHVTNQHFINPWDEPSSEVKPKVNMTLFTQGLELLQNNRQYLEQS